MAFSGSEFSKPFKAISFSSSSAWASGLAGWPRLRRTSISSACACFPYLLTGALAEPVLRVSLPVEGAIRARALHGRDAREPVDCTIPAPRVHLVEGLIEERELLIALAIGAVALSIALIAFGVALRLRRFHCRHCAVRRRQGAGDLAVLREGRTGRQRGRHYRHHKSGRHERSSV